MEAKDKVAPVYYLGLDLGISSCGWAVMGEHPELPEGDEQKYWLDDFGVRIFEPVETPKEHTPLAEVRRGFRSQRRLIRRRKHRLLRIKKLLDQYNIVGMDELDSYLKMLKSPTGVIKVTNQINYDASKYVNPYVLRAKALTQQISKLELGYIILNLANHRGYLNKFKDEEKGKLEAASENAIKFLNHQTIAQAVVNHPEFLKTNKVDIRNKSENYKYLFKRKDIVNELKLIIAAQSQYYPSFNDENLKTQLINIINNQRDFEQGPGPLDQTQHNCWINTLKKQRNYTFKKYVTFDKLIGTCKFSPTGEKVGMRSTVIFELYRLASEVSTITVQLKDDCNLSVVHTELLKYVLSAPEAELTLAKVKNKLIDLLKANLLANSKLKIDEFIKKEKSKDSKGTGIKVNLEFIRLCKKMFGNDCLDSINLSTINDSKLWFEFGEILSYNITPQLRRKKLTEFLTNHNLSTTNIDLAVDYGNTGTATLCYTIMQDWLNQFAAGMPVNLIMFKAPIFFKNQTNNKQFLGPLTDPDLIINQTVYRAINQTRKVLKALFNRYHKFSNLNVEVGRELAAAKLDRLETMKAQAKNQSENNIAAFVLKSANIPVNETTILKYKLWKQQHEKCMYSQQPISLVDLADTSLLQIDHIIPISILGDDSFNNKVLVYSKYNQDKGQRTPLEWLTNSSNPIVTPSSFKQFVMSIAKSQTSSSKKTDQGENTTVMNTMQLTSRGLSKTKLTYLLMPNINDERLTTFINRNLNDSRYIARYVLNWLNDELKQYYQRTNEHLVQVRSNGNYRIFAIPGQVTSFFRRHWLNNPDPNCYSSAWGLETKVRDISVWHHAVDASILASFKNDTHLSFARDIISVIMNRNRFAKNRLTANQYNWVIAEILWKWSNKNPQHYLYQDSDRWSNYLSTLADINKPLPDHYLESTIIDLAKILDTRLPVKLKIRESKPLITAEEKEENPLVINKPNVIREPEFVDVLSETEYYDQFKDYHCQGNIHYPYVSYMQINKIRGAFTSSELPMKTAKLKTADPKTVYRDQDGNAWNMAKYHGFYLDENKTAHWITKFEIQHNKEKYKHLKVYTPNSNFLYKYNNKWLMVRYTGKSNDRLIITINGIVNKFNMPNLNGRLIVSCSKFASGDIISIPELNLLGKYN